jgi:hypothetical protein
MTDDEWQAHVAHEAAKAIGEWLEGRGRLHQPIRSLTMPELEAMAQNAISRFIVLASRWAPAQVFRHAARLHDGAFLSPDEVPAILQKGERVLSRREAAEFGRGPAEQAPNVVVNFSVTTPEIGAFRQSQGQLSAMLSQAVERGMRHR